jgi:hypothetical protein
MIGSVFLYKSVSPLKEKFHPIVIRITSVEGKEHFTYRKIKDSSEGKGNNRGLPACLGYSQIIQWSDEE